MDVIYEYYYKETKLESGKIVIEKGFVNYECIYKSLQAINKQNKSEVK